MVRLTIDLIRKRAEHNEGEISTLEEIALHQENIEKIEILNQTSRNLRILLMQNNLIARIENLNMLKRLEYLNLALNNIELIENLEGLESLKKLDLTVNFIGDLTSVKRLRCNEHLEQLFLTGNPCTDYSGYREYVVATLPQLKELDMTQIERSERILALQSYPETKGDVIRAYRKYAKIREMQMNRHRERERVKITELNERGLESTPIGSEEDDDEEENSRFWSEKTYHTPEDRIEIAERSAKRQDQRKRSSNKEENSKYVPKLFSPEGRPYNINQAKVTFALNDESDRDNVILEVAAYRHLDTAHLDVDVQPNYVRVTIKGKILQLSLPCEVSIGGSNAKRNVTTGCLVITMPRLNPLPIIGGIIQDQCCVQPTLKSIAKKHRRMANKVVRQQLGPVISKRELLEIGPPGKDTNDLDFSRIYKDKHTLRREISEDKEKIVSEDFVDDPEVPPLE